jgi:nicotinamidase/pyrazinamidase
MGNKTKKSLSISDGDVLLIVDIQNDFLPGGALGVKEGNEIIDPVNRAVQIFLQNRLPVLYSRDWHPPNHCSFLAYGGPWPPHCIRDTAGAAFSAEMAMPKAPLVFSKGINAEMEQYSAFDAVDEGGSPLRQILQRFRVKRVFIGGLATDYCVLNSAIDLLKAGYDVVVLRDACRAVNVDPTDGEKAFDRMIAEGAKTMTTEDFDKP